MTEPNSGPFATGAPRNQIAPAMWAELNERQRTYLRTLYECDQATETARREDAASGRYDRTPASEWRWQMYGPVGPPSALYTALKARRLVDPGTGSTWKALEDRKLVQCRYVPDALGIIDLLEVQITPLGRKLVRAATGERPAPRLSKGTLRERQWAALARLYAAGDDGENTSDMLYARGGFQWYPTLFRLRQYKPSPLMEEYRTPYHDNGDGTYRAPEDRLRITPFGRVYYQREWARYRELYPAIDAPQPTARPRDYP